MRPTKKHTKSSLVLSALLALALLVPAGAQAFPRGFFGIVPQTPIAPADTARMRAGGVDTIRAPFPWQGIEPTASSGFEWGGIDGLVAVAAKRGIEIMPFLSGTPRWLSHDWRRLPIDNARQRQRWARFVRAAVDRYGPRGRFWAEHGPGSAERLPRHPIRAWQIWNEENFFYFTRPASPVRYARLLAISARAVHHTDARAKVVTGGLFGEPNQRPPRAMSAVDFLTRLYRVRGAKRSFDAIALHPYAAGSRDLRRLVEGVRDVMVENHDARAGLYITEMGWGSQHDPNVVSFEVGWRPQARELRRAYAYLIGNRRRLNLRQIDWFTWKDEVGGCNFCDSTGLFRRGEPFKAKPAWHSFVAATRGRFGR